MFTALFFGLLMKVKGGGLRKNFQVFTVFCPRNSGPTCQHIVIEILIDRDILSLVPVFYDSN